MTLLPTLNRIRLLKQFLQSAIDCNTTTPGMIIVDENDYQKNKDHYDNLTMPKNWSVVKTKAVKMGDKIREVWPLVEKSGCKWVNLLNDDHVIKTKGWDRILEDRIDGTNFVTCNDGWMSPRKASGATVFSMGLLKTVGIPIYPNGMAHLFIDDLWESIGRSTGVWEVDHSVLIEHHNQLKTPDKRDETFGAIYGTGPNVEDGPLWKNDHAVYQSFMTNDFPEIRNKIRKLRGQIEINYQA